VPTAVAFDPAVVSDLALRPTADKVAAGRRLDAADALALFRSSDLRRTFNDGSAAEAA
jgi:hypothetical protein